MPDNPTQLLHADASDAVTCKALVTKVSPATAGQIDVQLDRTCFYPRGNGQDWDMGTIAGPGGAMFEVTEVRLDQQGVVHHLGKFRIGKLAAGEQVNCMVATGRRKITTWLHSAGHVIDLAVQQLNLPWVPGRSEHYIHRSFASYRGKLISGTAKTLKQKIEAAANNIIATNSGYNDRFDKDCGGAHTDPSIFKPITITKITTTKDSIRVWFSIGGEPPFLDRADAGKQLAASLAEYANTKAVVYSLPRGGTVVGAAVAKRLVLPHDIIITRKIGHPTNAEEAIGAIAETSEVLWDLPAGQQFSKPWLDQAVQRQRTEVQRRQKVYLKNRPRTPASGKIAIIVDDGAASGLTIIAAIKKLLREQPKKIIIALPVASEQAVAKLHKHADKIFCLKTLPPQSFTFVAVNFQNFPEVTDDEMLQSIQ